MKRVNLVAFLTFILPINIAYQFRFSLAKTDANQNFMLQFNNKKIILASAKILY
jgi:hypothetical protein